jgi:signal recognition particle subunit SRP68
LANSSSLTSKLPKLDPSPELVKSLHSTLSSLQLHHRALLYLHTLTPGSDSQAQKYAPPLVERLDTYPAGGVDLNNLVTYPPKLAPVPVKPLFFDVAWNYIDYPGREPKEPEQTVQQEKKPQETQKKKGWFSFGS